MAAERTIDTICLAPTPERIQAEKARQLEMFKKFLNELNMPDEVQLRGHRHRMEMELSEARGT